MTTDTTNRPSHYVYAVRKGSKGGKAFWTRIGAAWANRDGEGFSVKLDLNPLDDADIVTRSAARCSASGPPCSTCWPSSPR